MNEKHGNKVYCRAGGIKADIASETEELGQQLLDKAIEVKGKLLSVYVENSNRIFEFRHSYTNKYHGFQREGLPIDLQKPLKGGYLRIVYR